MKIVLDKVENSGKFATMKDEKRESVKVSSSRLNKVRVLKKKTGVGVGAFIDIAIDEKIEKEKKAK